MAMITEYDLENETWTHTTPPSARHAFREAVAEVAAKARTKLPQCTGRIDSAVKIVLAGDVELLPDGGARVASRSDATVQYHTVNGHCDCKDFSRAPGNLCSHRLAYGIMRRATELAPQSPQRETAPSAEPVMLPAAPALPEAPASVNVHIMIDGRQAQVTLRDTDETRLLQRLAAVLQQYPAPQAPAVQGKPASGGNGQEKDWCNKHQVAMKQTTKDGRSWWSHRTAEGWCKGK